MWDLMIMGGLKFTFPLLLLLLAILGLIVFNLMRRGSARLQSLLLHLGIFSAVWGILGQALGLYQAMAAIESMGGEVSPALLAGGLKVSFIAPLFGLINLVMALLAWTVIRFRGD